MTLEKYFSDIRQNSLLTKEDEIELGKKIRKGDKEAFDKMVVCNLKLVIFIAKKFRNSGLEFDDLIAYGNIGLIKAVGKFDYTRGLKFNTMATWWIRQSITRAIYDTEKTMRIPVYMGGRIRKYLKIKDMIEKHLGFTPEKRDISNYSNLSLKQVSFYERLLENPISLDKSADECEEDLYSVIDFKTNPITHTNIDKEDLLKLLKCLDEKASKVVMMRYGLNMDRTYTLEEVGKEIGVTRERARQIEYAAINKLKHKISIKPQMRRILQEALHA